MMKFENDLEDLPSVDPHLIQPLVQQLALNDLQINRNLETDCANISEDAHPEDSTIPMEQCINLDWYLTPIRDTMTHCYTDELNTPDTFEAVKELNKIINTTTHQKQSDGNPFHFPETIKHQIKEDMATVSQAKSIIINANNNLEATNTRNATMNFQNSCSDVLVNVGTPNTQHERYSLLSPSSNFDLEDIDLEEYDFLNDYNDAILNDINMSLTDKDINTSAIGNNQQIIPVKTINEHHNYALKLKIDNVQAIPDFTTDNLQTPDIINTILQYDNTTEQGFKFTGKFISQEQIKQELSNCSPEPTEITFVEEVEQPETSLTEDESSLQSFASSTPSSSKNIRGRRRKYTDDDEEYLPPSVSKVTNHRPTKRRRTTTKASSDDDEYTPAKIPKRGRPSKPVSRASDSSECSKYREMRDKNNEASRRSRRKRRIQEQSIEEECDLLSVENNRLKTQVNELEKSVKTYRESLMALLLNRK